MQLQGGPADPEDIVVETGSTEGDPGDAIPHLLVAKCIEVGMKSLSQMRGSG